MHISRVIESELCFRKINTVTVHWTEILVRMLGICLGINPSEPHAHGFSHHLAYKPDGLYSLCDSRPVFPAPYKACPTSFLTRCSQSRAHHSLSPTAPHTATPLPSASPPSTPYTPRYTTILRPEFSLSSTSPTPFSPQPHGPSHHLSHHSHILPRLPSIFPLLNPTPFCPYWNCPRSSHQHSPFNNPSSLAIGLPTLCCPFFHSSTSISKLNLNLIMVFPL